MEILRVQIVTEELMEAVERLVPQLNPGATPPTRDQLQALVTSVCSELYAATDPASDPPILGMLTLAYYPVPTGFRVWIEDVVVDRAARGRGTGEALVRTALQRARELGARSVDLTSRLEREAANRLYQRLGFELRETNAYRLVFDSGPGQP